MPKFNGLTDEDLEILYLENSTYYADLLSELMDRRMKNLIDNDQLQLELKIINHRAMIQTIVTAVNRNTENLLAYLKAAETDPNLH
ncbi:hypothetical protein D3C75_665890 [compost metagenome]